MKIRNLGFLLGILILALPLISYCQTEKDTQEWIKSNLYNYVYSNGMHNYTVDFKVKGIMKIIQPIFDTDFYYNIPLSKIDQVIINPFKVDEREGYTIKLICKNRESCIVVTNNKPSSDMPAIEYLTARELYLNKSFGFDNLPNRMKKAITHLIELNGGKTINDIF